jgi:hypothetical protein
MNAGTVRLQGIETERIGTVPHLPPALTTDLILSLSEASETKEKNKSVQFKSTGTMNAGTARLQGFKRGEG